MSRFKKFFNLVTLIIGVLVGVFLPTHFSVAQSIHINFDLLAESDFFQPIMSFLMPKHDIYLYAVTAPNEYDIHFDANGGEGSMADLHMKYDEAQDLPDNEFTNGGSSFLGWSRNPGGPVQFENQTGVINLTAENTGHVTLYAQREATVPYTIEYCLERLVGTGCDIETGTAYGSEGTGIILTGMAYTGFTLQTGDEVNITSGGTVQYRYTRNIYRLTMTDRDNTLINAATKYGASIPVPAEDPVWSGNTFVKWANLPDDRTMPAYNLDITSEWIIGPHSITFDTDGGSEIPPFTGEYGDDIVRPPNPTKDGYEFVQWAPDPLPTKISGDDVRVKAIWRKVDNSSSGGWSGRGRRNSGDDNEDQNEDNNQQHGSAGTQSGNKTNVLPVDMEEIVAYRWAKKNGIIDDSWVDSYPNGYLTRGDMAEMVVRFATNILGREIPTEYPWRCAWDDPKNQRWSPDTQVYANKACRLGLMGMWMKEFMPNKTMDRAEFGTILSRLLRGHMYDVINPSDTNPYYVKHLEALNKEGIMKNIENPLQTLERRKWVWMMMMRTAQKMPKGENAESK